MSNSGHPSQRSFKTKQNFGWQHCSSINEGVGDGEQVSRTQSTSICFTPAGFYSKNVLSIYKYPYRVSCVSCFCFGHCDLSVLTRFALVTQAFRYYTGHKCTIYAYSRLQPTIKRLWCLLQMDRFDIHYVVLTNFIISKGMSR